MKTALVYLSFAQLTNIISMMNPMFSSTKLVHDLALDLPFVRGVDQTVSNCWHFSTDGNCLDVMFYDETDFTDAMNRIYIVSSGYIILVLAFCLMDNHIHFVLYGDFDECNRFIHEYVRRTSMAISERHGDRKKLSSVPIHFQKVDTDRYLKTVICYVIKNPMVAGLPYTYFDYPWSSGALYFRAKSQWTSPNWSTIELLNTDSWRSQRSIFKTREKVEGDAISTGMILPNKYVAVDVVERIFRTHKSYNYFLLSTRERDVEERGGVNSPLSIPDNELRQRKQEVCSVLFGVKSTKLLTVNQRVALAQELGRQFSCSPKQLARVCGLVYKEVENKITFHGGRPQKGV